jgi:hypothetical protein
MEERVKAWNITFQEEKNNMHIDNIFMEHCFALSILLYC